MDIEVIEDGSVALVRPEGKLDSASSPEFEATMSGVVSSREADLIVDLGSVTFMASAGLRALLVVAKKQSRSKRALRVFGLNGLVRETFEISGFVSIIDVRESETEARQGLA